jgi:hypothetical protein
MTRRRLGYLISALTALVVGTGIVLVFLAVRGSDRSPRLASATNSPGLLVLVTPPAPTDSLTASALTPSPTPAVPRSVTPTGDAGRSSPAAPAASNVGRESVPIIYDQSVEGNAVTKDFQVPSQWLIYWSYACSPPASSAGQLTVAIYLKGVGEPLKSFSNKSGSTSGVERNFVGDGWYHLSIAASCPWRITVTPAPGSVSPSPSG